MSWRKAVVVGGAALAGAAAMAPPVAYAPPPIVMAVAAPSPVVVQMLAPDAGVSARHPMYESVRRVLAKRAARLDPELREELAQIVCEEADEANLDVALVLGVMGAESSYRQWVVSHKGAMGLMQVRPDTLRYLAHREGLRYSDAELELNTLLQVRLAIGYLGKLKRSFGGREDLALMAYNAGPTALVNKLRAGEAETLRPYVNAVGKHTHGVKRLMRAHDQALSAGTPRFGTIATD